MLLESGFKVGKEFAELYQPGKITLVLIVRDETTN